MENTNKTFMPLWLKTFLNPVDIYAAQTPLLKLSLITGIAPLKLIGSPGNRRLEVNLFGFMNTFLHICLFFGCYVRTIFFHESIVSYFFKTEISAVGDTLQLCIGLIGIIVTLLYSLIQRNKFVAWFHLMAKIDDHFKEIGVETDYKSTLKFISWVLLFKAIFFIAYLVGSWILFKTENIYPNFSCWVSFFLPHLMIAIIVVLFLCLVKQMKHRFLLLNKVCISIWAITITTHFNIYSKYVSYISLKFILISESLFKLNLFHFAISYKVYSKFSLLKKSDVRVCFYRTEEVF